MSRTGFEVSTQFGSQPIRVWKKLGSVFLKFLPRKHLGMGSVSALAARWLHESVLASPAK
jgi:hypothetical protein